MRNIPKPGLAFIPFTAIVAQEFYVRAKGSVYDSRSVVVASFPRLGPRPVYARFSSMTITKTAVRPNEPDDDGDGSEEEE